MIKEGMYVEFREFDENGVSVKKIGQWVTEEDSKSEINVYEWNEKSKLVWHPTFCSTSLLTRAKLRIGAKCVVNGEVFTIQNNTNRRSDGDHYLYYCSSDTRGGNFLLSEKEMHVSYDSMEFNIYDLINGNDYCDAFDFLNRFYINKYVTETNVMPEGYMGAIGKRISLMEHQLDTVQSVTRKTPIRAILADEVGLGKTIEALVILDYAIKKGLCQRALIVVPDQLKYQWYYEAINKFGMDVGVFLYFEYLKGDYKHNICIISDMDFRCYAQDFNWNVWSFVICDEVHRAVRDDLFYKKMLRASKKAEHLLLLSATPLLNRGKEMYRLLSLYNPTYYEKMGCDEFNKIIANRKRVSESIERVLPGFKIGINLKNASKCMFTYRDIAQFCNDEQLMKLLSMFDDKDEKKSIDGVNIATDYINKRYEIVPKYVRHRRADILDPSSKRRLYAELSYAYKEDNEEQEIYELLQYELKSCLEEGKISVENVMAVGNACFSTYSALYSMLIETDLYKILPQTFHKIFLKQSREKKELSNIRLNKLVEYIKDSPELFEQKTIIFTDYYISAEMIKDRLVKEFGEEKVTLFTTNKGGVFMITANNSFKNIKECCFMVCDKKGAEGRNLQFADNIIHFDSPWVPTDIEQRIGRLDRVGREKGRPVNNIVIYSKDSIEEELIDLMKNVLMVYDESLCGIEIVFDQITELISASVRKNALVGFGEYTFGEIRKLKDSCEEAIVQEDVKAMMAKVEMGLSDKFDTMVDRLTGETYNKFVESICNNHSRNGYKVKTKGKEVYLEGIDGEDDIIGTFWIDEALREDGVEFLSLSNKSIAKIVNSVLSNDKYRFSAVRIRGTGTNWKGFITSWRVSINTREIMGENWNDGAESIPNIYIDDPMMLIANSIGKEQMMAEEVIEKLTQAVVNSNYENIDLNTLESILGDTNIRSVAVTVEQNARDLFELQMNTKINKGLINQDIDSAKREYYVNQFLKSEARAAKERAEALRAVKVAMDNVDGIMDSMLFVVFEK